MSIAGPRSRRDEQAARLLYRNRLLRALFLIGVTVVVGTLGYHLLEGWAYLDALYMTMITLTTVGYGETHPLNPPGRIFTMVLLVTSIGIAGYAVSTLGSFIIEGEFRRIVQGRRMDKQIAGLKNHIVLCGAGHTGEHIAAELYKSKTPFVIVEHNLDVIQQVQQIGDIPYLHADATQDETLRLAGIERASGLVAALGEDKDNLFIVLSARSLNPRLRIIARLLEEKNAEKLRKAGADEVVSPNAIGGLRMASLIIRPSVVSFLDEMLRVRGQTLRVEEVTLNDHSSLVGKTLVEADIGRRLGLLVVAIRSADREYQFNPRAQTVLKGGDVLFVIGTRNQVDALQQLGAP
ncbi:MAG: potassium channel protein [Ardenticatenaceae bacterium]|nr:potassium channel protein [Ardenticatenaceae bacterium]HBY94924.1 potassium channel protein [Chloroflexota bacterium]